MDVRPKALGKAVVDAAALALVLPAFAAYRLGAVALGRQKAFPGWSQALSLVPGLTGVTLRRAFYRLALSGCGADACITFGSVF